MEELLLAAEVADDEGGVDFRGCRYGAHGGLLVAVLGEQCLCRGQDAVFGMAAALGHGGVHGGDDSAEVNNG